MKKRKNIYLLFRLENWKIGKLENWKIGKMNVITCELKDKRIGDVDGCCVESA